MGETIFAASRASFDVSMPEEINRMVTDAITDYFYVTSNVAISNLINLRIDLKVDAFGFSDESKKMDTSVPPGEGE